MYLENFDRARTAVATPVSGRRSLSGEFVFISQDDSVGFLAEACIDVLRSANRLTGQPAYDWSHVRGEAGLADLDGPLCGPDQTLVLIGGTDAPWQPSAEGLVALRAAIRNAARVCVVGSAVFVPLAAGVLATVKRDAIERGGGDWSAEDEAEFKRPTIEMFERQSHPLYASARLWDDGIVDPRKTREVLYLSLLAALNAPIEETRFGVFRM